MVNLFLWQAGASALPPGALSGSLVTLLSHVDRRLLSSFLALCGLSWEATEPLAFHFPAAELPTAAEVRAPGRWRLLILAQAPAAAWEPAWVEGARQSAANGAEESRLLLIAPAIEHLPSKQEIARTWEQVDRWLEQEADNYPPDTRTGFLLEQFREFLPAVGLTYFTGFDPDDLAASATALTTLQRLVEQADQFFAHLEPVLGSLWPGLEAARSARPEDILSGYLYRDFTCSDWGEGAFLRGALHLGQRSLDVGFWLAGPGGPHARLAGAAEAIFPRLAAVEGLVVRLWRVGGEEQIPALEAAAAAIDWSQYQVGFQVSLGFDTLQPAGLTAQTAEWARQIVEALAPVLAPAREVH